MLHNMRLPGLEEEYNSQENEIYEKKIATEEEYRIVLEQKQILNNYVSDFTEIAKRREKGRWDKIKE